MTLDIEKLEVKLPSGNYDILIGYNNLSYLNHYSYLFENRKVFIITDSKVNMIHFERLETVFKSMGIQFKVLVINDGEKSKNLATIEQITNFVLDNSPDRNAILVAFGGGVIGDLTGFAASIILRGISYIQIPTTLLAQVDSSIGGKTGINTKQGKNLIGSFYQPNLVLTDTSFIETQSYRNYISGYAEVVKLALIADKVFFDFLTENAEKIKVKNREILLKIVKKSCQIKADIVVKDEKEEKNIRALLNLGHTFAHALEKELNFSDVLTHGEAVSIGMLAAFNLSIKLGYCNNYDSAKLLGHLVNVGLPISTKNTFKSFDINKLVEYMYIDKKVENEKLTFILTKGIGNVFVVKDVHPKYVRETLEELVIT